MTVQVVMPGYHYKLPGAPITPDELDMVRFLADECGYICVVIIGDGRWAALSKLLYTCAILTGIVGDKNTVDDRWCYDSQVSAALALGQWCADRCKGEPQGWHRHPSSGRRRDRKGNEHVAM